jgi:hypothetical protein
MCDFVSWIEKNGEVLFLTGEDIYNTKRGKELQKYCGLAEDLKGHGAIRWYYGNHDGNEVVLFKGGKERECTDFSNPKNFPPEIIDALKVGKMHGFIFPFSLLVKSKWDAIYKEYQPKWDAIDKEYQSKRDAIYKEYQSKWDAIYKEYQSKRDAIYKEYQPKWDAIYKEYQSKRDAIDKEYQNELWNAFSIKENRNYEWR